jgi:hypothetical protein
MGSPFRIGLKDRSLAALTKGRYRKGLGAVFLHLLVIFASAAVFAILAAFVVRFLPWILPLAYHALAPSGLWLERFSWMLGGTPVAPAYFGVLELIALQGFLAVLMAGGVAGSLLLVVLPSGAGLQDLLRTNRENPVDSRADRFEHFRKERYFRAVRTYARLLVALAPSIAPGAVVSLSAMAFVAFQYGTDAEWVTFRTPLRADSFAALVLPVLFALAVAALGFLPAYFRAIAYRPVPWLLGAMPDLSPREVVRLSERMTRGRRMDLFLLDLSFLGWVMLALSTCGLGFPFLAPYYEAVQAEAFARLVEEAEGAGVLVRRSRSTRMDPLATHTGFP